MSKAASHLQAARHVERQIQIHGAAAHRTRALVFHLRRFAEWSQFNGAAYGR